MEMQTGWKNFVPDAKKDLFDRQQWSVFIKYTQNDSRCKYQDQHYHQYLCDSDMMSHSTSDNIC